jgi:hypothetical protein
LRKARVICRIQQGSRTAARRAQEIGRGTDAALRCDRDHGLMEETQRTNKLGSMLAIALNTVAVVSVVRMMGPRRIARLAALATEGYLVRLGRNRPHR